MTEAILLIGLSVITGILLWVLTLLPDKKSKVKVSLNQDEAGFYWVSINDHYLKDSLTNDREKAEKFYEYVKGIVHKPKISTAIKTEIV